MSSQRKRKQAGEGAAGTSAAPGAESADPPRGLNKAATRGLLKKLNEPRYLGPGFIDDDDMALWEQWLNSEPDTVSQVSAAEWPLPISMPKKCIPRAATGQGSTPADTQQEIISYSNVSGRRFTTDDRSRQYSQTQQLRADDLPVGSTIAINQSSPLSAPGFGTPFYIGDVMAITSDDEGFVTSYTIHYRMPRGQDSLFCNDMMKPWMLACHAQHVWDGRCERQIACRRAKDAAGGTSTKYAYTGDAKEILDTKLQLNQSGTLKKACRVRLSKGAPTPGEWDSALGL